MKEHHKSLSNQMPKWQKYIYFAFMLFGNAVVNKIPSRHLRLWYYKMLGAKVETMQDSADELRFLIPRA